LKDACAQVDSLRAELQKEKDRAQAAGAERAQARDAQNKAESARQEIEAAWTEQARAKAAIESELKEVRRLYESARAESARVSQQVESAATERAKLEAALCDGSAQLQAAEAQCQTLTAQLEAGIARIEALECNGAENDRARHDLQVRLDAAVTAEAMLLQRAAEADREAASAQRGQVVRFGSLLDRSLTAVNNLKASRTVADVLTAVVMGLASEFSRVVLFSVKGNQLEGEQQIGFDFEDHISKVAIPLTTDTLVTRAVASGRSECLTASEFTDNNRALFGGTPACALALPIAAYGETLAVIYADDSDQPQSQFAPAARDVRVKFAELLLRLAVMPLRQVSPQLKALAELEDYAAMLLSEAEYIYATDISAGKKAAELQCRLRDNLECARRIYAQRVVSEEPRAATLLEQRLAAVIETRSATPFGHDLAAIAADTGLDSSPQGHAAD